MQSVQSVQSVQPAQPAQTEVSVPELPPIDRAAVKPSDWHQMVGELDLAGMPRQLADNCELVVVEADLVRLQLETAAEHLNSEHALNRVQSAISTWLGRQVRLTIDTVEGSLQTPYLIDEKARAKRLADAQESIAQDPIVQSLVERVDGAVDHGSIRPLSDR